MKKRLTTPSVSSSISSKYQTVIPMHIRKKLGLKIHEELMWHVVSTKKQPIVVVTPKPKNWANYLSGLGKEVWKDIDTEEYLQQLKKEWPT